MEQIEANNTKEEVAKQLCPVAESSLKRAMMEDDMERGAVMAGQIVPLVKKVMPASEIIDNILIDAKERLEEITKFEF